MYYCSMRRDKEIAIKLRSTGKSYNEIVAALKISKSTLSEWFSGEDWSEKIKAKLIEAAQQVSTIRMRELDRIRGVHLKRIYEEARAEAAAEFEQLKYNPLFIAGVMLYWGEGDRKTHYQVRITNTDPKMIQLFVVFLRKVCNIPEEKIHGSVLTYPDLNDEECRSYWSAAARVPLKQFHRCTKIVGRHKTNRLAYGVCSILVSSTYFKAKVVEWLSLLPKELMGKQYYESI